MHTQVWEAQLQRIVGIVDYNTEVWHFQTLLYTVCNEAAWNTCLKA